MPSKQHAIIGRREFMTGALAIVGAGVVTACGGGDGESPTATGVADGAADETATGTTTGSSATARASTAAATNPQAAATTAATSVPNCVITPELTEGPYFVDEKLTRTDIRSDPASGAVSEGVPLKLAFRVLEVNGTQCAPIADALVDVWHCDALGVYSDVGSASGKKFLRGNQRTDASGVANFVTVYPGWYRGRAVHIHFKVRTGPDSNQGTEFTSQIFFDEAVNTEVFKLQPYAKNGAADTPNARDGIFRNGGDKLTVPVTRDGQGYAGTFDVGVNLA